jgi:hypothetical protein
MWAGHFPSGYGMPASRTRATRTTEVTNDGHHIPPQEDKSQEQRETATEADRLDRCPKVELAIRDPKDDSDNDGQREQSKDEFGRFANRHLGPIRRRWLLSRCGRALGSRRGQVEGSAPHDHEVRNPRPTQPSTARLPPESSGAGLPWVRACLENRCRPLVDRGFESLPLRYSLRTIVTTPMQ